MAKGVTDRDLGYERLRKEFAKANRGPGVKVGVQGNTEPSQDGVDAIMLAAIHEFGAEIADGFGRGIHIRIPERSFVRSSLDAHRQEMRTLVDKLHTQWLRGKVDLETALKILGETHQAHIQRTIRAPDGPGPALADRTIEEKESSNPLVDTGFLARSIRYAIEMG